jgi:hypothetical protein
MRSLQQFWSVRRIGEDRVTLARLGTLRIWLARAEKEWGMASERGEANGLHDIAQVPGDVVPEKLEWKNLLFKEAPREYSFRPEMPDRPVVVKPVHPVTIPEGESGVIHALVPVFIRVVLLSGKRETTLGVIPSERLSDTWFGTPVRGQLCYTVPQRATVDPDDLDVHPHHVQCTLEVENRSGEPLEIHKACLHLGHASLHSGNDHLWSSVLAFRHAGGMKGTSVSYPDRLPEAEKGLLKVAQPQRKDDRSLNWFTFGSSTEHETFANT